MLQNVDALNGRLQTLVYECEHVMMMMTTIRDTSLLQGSPLSLFSWVSSYGRTWCLRVPFGHAQLEYCPFECGLELPCHGEIMDDKD
jgi:hypothetical protein